jgi:hypothetical protein
MVTVGLDEPVVEVAEFVGVEVLFGVPEVGRCNGDVKKKKINKRTTSTPRTLKKIKRDFSFSIAFSVAYRLLRKLWIISAN